MNLAKLESVKAALRLVVAHGDNLHLENKINRYEEFEFSNFSTSDYIAKACNLGAPMAKGYLDLFNRLECEWQDDTSSVELRLAAQDTHASILNSFPDDI